MQRGDTAIRPLPFALAGLSSCVGALVTNPLDVARVRSQVHAGRGQLRALLATVASLRREPLRHGALRGLHVSFAREFTYSGVRMGAYEPFRGALEGALGAGLAAKLLAGAASGVVGACVGQPFDLLKTRVMGLPAGSPPPRVRALAAEVAAARGGGARALFTTGLALSAQRAGVLTAAQVGGYDHAKGLLKRHGGLVEGPALHFSAAWLAGFAATAASSPLDVAKTRVMGGAWAGGALSAVAVVLSREGPAALFRGFIPSFLRLGLHSTATFSVLEALRRFFLVQPL